MTWKHVGCAIGLAALASGCELLIPLGISEATRGEPAPVAAAEAPLEVRVESASGTVRGVALEAATLEGSGVRFGRSLSFELGARSQDLSLRLHVPSTESSADNPYAEDDPLAGAGAAAPQIVDAGALLPEIRSATELAACGADGRCDAARDVAVEIVQTAQARRATVEATWSDGTWSRVVFAYGEGS